MMFSEYAPILKQNGWEGLIPLIPREKRPTICGWQQFNHAAPSVEQIEYWCGQYPEAGIGLCAGHNNIIGLDLDHLDWSHAQNVQQLASAHLGETSLIRIGKAPKSLRLYRLADGEAPLQSKKYTSLVIEIFASTGQVVLFGYHVGAGCNYVWPKASPLELGPHDVAVVTQADLKAFLNACPPIAKGGRLGSADHKDYRLDGDSSGVSLPFFEAFRQNPDVDPRHVTAELLANAVEGARHPSMLGAVYALASIGLHDSEIQATLGSIYASLFNNREAAIRLKDLNRAIQWCRTKGIVDLDESRRELRRAAWSPWST